MNAHSYTSLHRLAVSVNSALSHRIYEMAAARKYLRGCQSVLDVGCGTGEFMERAEGEIIGIDINPQNVDYCLKRGLKAQTGNALALPFSDRQFDGVHCSHLLQVFAPDQAVQLLKEMARVVRPGGVIVITTLNSFRRFWRHPENVRPYPPDAIYRLFAKQHGSTSPMWPDMPPLRIESIWLRHPPLVELEFTTSYRLQRIAGVLNTLQHAFFLRKYWCYHAYTLQIRTRAE